jgi:hypothetical protein
MRRRLFCPLLAAAVLATALGGVAAPASAAIRIIISDGSNPANDKVFYSAVPGSENTLAVFSTTTFDGYEFVFTATSSNFPGNSSQGFLNQFVTVTDLGGGALPQFQVSTAIIANQGSLATGEVFGMDAANVRNAPLLVFTQPNDALLSVSSSVNTTGPMVPGATVQLQTVVNGSTTTSMTAVDGTQNTATGTAAGPGYTLASTIVVTGLPAGVLGLQLNGQSSVSGLIPEPASLLVWGLGAAGLVYAARRRLVVKAAA